MRVNRRAAACLFLTVGLVQATLSLLVTVQAADAPPRVIGFERFYAPVAASADSRVAAGELLLGELNCTSCHAANPQLTDRIQPKQAAVLDLVGSRVKPQYLSQFLANPQAAKPGTTMPNVLAHLSDSERQDVVECLVHFLASTGNVTHANPLRRGVVRGEELFHSVGCVACHDPRKNDTVTSLSTSIPLGVLSKEYTLPSLAKFLEDPLAVRPSGRMPHLNLSAIDAHDIASFLLNDLDIVSGLQYAYYEGSWEKLPDFTKLAAFESGDATNFDLSVAKRREQFALRFEGAIQIERDGEYLFLIGSDDGSRLLIDDKVVLNNDGVHPFEQKRKKVKMTAGLHSVVVEYFEQAGEESLQVDFEGPGQTQQPLATLLATAAPSKAATTVAEAFQVDSTKAQKGKEHFSSLGCAACHELKSGGSRIVSRVVSTRTARPLAALAAGGGCLLGTDRRLPQYALSARQQESLAAAIQSTKSAQELTPSETIHRTLVRLNCYACHERDQVGGGNVGGVEEARNGFFQSDMPEMGDEGRLPPSLRGVGAKLNPEWLRTVLDQGAKDRPYMLTHMPKFGLANVGGLVAAFQQADSSFAKSAPSLAMNADDEKRIKAAGRRLVGSQGFACIKCHTFASHRSSGIQALSLTTMTKRLRPEWFYHYVQNPLAYRPGTRMPTPFPDGQTTLPSVLDGTVHQQIAAIWNYLSDGDEAILPVGLVTGKMELIAFDEPVIFRNFIQGAGTRAIGVGFPEKLNLAFDANSLRIAMLWHGGFIDAAKHWTARGAGFERPLGDRVLHLPGGPPLAVLNSDAEPWPTASPKEAGYQFRGYRLDEKRRPTFLYSWKGVAIEDFPRPVGDQDVYAIQRTITIGGAIRNPQPEKSLWYRAAAADTIEQRGDGVYSVDGRWTLRVSDGVKPRVRKQGDQWELLVPVISTANAARIELNYDW